ncbi:MAG TPA: cytochrome c3 family protein [Terriglobia bacterium]|nr:cytochrome c3 family protein [Terriglobia bacterium]
MKPASESFIFTIVVALMLFCGEPALADIHPVALDKDTDSAKCVSCHEDKAKGKVIHDAIPLGCNVCHQVRVNRDITRVTLVATTPVNLCLTCHADKNAANIKGLVHSPGVRDCLKCHDPHTSDNKNLLLKPTSGDPKENLCLTCHRTGVDVPEKGSRHAALDAGCDTCHVIHKSGASPDAEFRYHLAKAVPALCLDCHDVTDSSLIKAHQNQPFEKADCLSCHDPHQSDQPGLMQKFVHVPFGEKQCAVCHQQAKDGKVVLTQPSAKELCVTCHADQAKKIENAKVPHPGAMGDCTDCHSPHAGKSPGFPQPDAVNVCLSCHTDIAGEVKKHTLHQPAFQQGCAICHEPHGGDRPNLLRADGNALCLECHGPEAQPTKLEKEHLVAIFDGKVKLPENYFAQVPILPLQNGVGHPTRFHPVSDVIDPKTKTITPISCLTCHQPHSSANHGLLVKDQAANMAFCRTCHKEGTLQLK